MITLVLVLEQSIENRFNVVRISEIVLKIVMLSAPIRKDLGYS